MWERKQITHYVAKKHTMSLSSNVSIEENTPPSSIILYLAKEKRFLSPRQPKSTKQMSKEVNK